MTNDNVPKKYQIGTKIGMFFFSRGRGIMENVQYVPEIVKNVPIWYIFGRTHK